MDLPINVQYRVHGYFADYLYDFVKGCIIDSLDLKQNKDLSEQALGGAKLIDTEDFYQETKKVYPETEEQVVKRGMNVAKYYREQHAKSKGKNIARLVFTHREIMASMPKYFGAGEREFAEYVASFEIAL